MKNLTCILAIVALLISVFSCANFSNVLPMGKASDVNPFVAGDSFHDADGIMLDNNDWQDTAPDDSNPKSVKTTSDFTAAALCRLPGAPSHICGTNVLY
ncbi:MAG: hypothetical protein JRF25_09040 [Deltaproteobacteria bacterium]|nr:hypothetical protein [Deltaproteobacteria bacterium]